MLFDTAIEHVLQSEGGYVNDPADAGGETKWGISKRSYPSVDIQALTRDAAKAIYRRDYWEAARCDDIPDAVRLVHFDCAVNQGVGSAARMLQAAVGVVVDGKIGPKTIAAVQMAHPGQLREDYLWLRASAYARLAVSKTTQRKFLPGWILRLVRVREAAVFALVAFLSACQPPDNPAGDTAPEDTGSVKPVACIEILLTDSAGVKLSPARMVTDSCPRKAVSPPPTQRP